VKCLFKARTASLGRSGEGGARSGLELCATDAVGHELSRFGAGLILGLCIGIERIDALDLEDDELLQLADLLLVFCLGSLHGRDLVIGGTARDVPEYDGQNAHNCDGGVEHVEVRRQLIVGVYSVFAHNCTSVRG